MAPAQNTCASQAVGQWLSTDDVEAIRAYLLKCLADPGVRKIACETLAEGRTMKTVLLGLLCVLMGVGTAAAQAPAQADHETQKKVLVIHASRQDAPYTVLIERAFRKTLGDGLAGHLDYYTEYIDFGRFSAPEYQMAMRDFLRRKYAGQRLDVIITEGHAPFEFVVRHRAEIFPGAPLVFSLEEGNGAPSRTPPAWFFR